VKCRGNASEPVCVSVYKVDCTRFLDKAFQGHQRKNNEEYPKKGSTIEKTREILPVE